MASFDDLAFIAPPSSAAAINGARDLFCHDCNDVVTQTTTDGKRCLVCGCELEVRGRGQHTGSNADPFPSGNGDAQDLRSLIMRLFEEVGGDWNNAGHDNRRPAADDAVAHLGSFTADQATTIEVAIAVKGIKGEVVAIPANFGPCEPVTGAQLVLAEPFDGAKPFDNADKMKDKIVVLERGGVTFAKKASRAQAAGAVAVIIVQTLDVWPYTMTDSTDEGKDLSIPAFMISAKHGKGFAKFLGDNSGKDIVADIAVRKDARECVICQVEMSIGTKVTRMPCQHLFHTECLHEWLKIGNSCPICRVEIPAKPTATGGIHSALNAQQRGDFAWSDWFS